jgi:hypothetical protein
MMTAMQKPQKKIDTGEASYRIEAGFSLKTGRLGTMEISLNVFDLSGEFKDWTKEEWLELENSVIDLFATLELKK